MKAKHVSLYKLPAAPLSSTEKDTRHTLNKVTHSRQPLSAGSTLIYTHSRQLDKPARPLLRLLMPPPVGRERHHHEDSAAHLHGPCMSPLCDAFKYFIGRGTLS